MVITVGIWAFAAPSRAVNYLAISGFGLATNVMCGSYLGSSLLTIPPEYFRGIINLAAWGFTVFSYGLLALFFCFPTRLFRWPIGETVFAIGVALQASVSFELFAPPFIASSSPTFFRSQLHCLELFYNGGAVKTTPSDAPL